MSTSSDIFAASRPASAPDGHSKPRTISFREETITDDLDTATLTS